MSYFKGPHSLFKGPDIPVSLMGLMAVLLSRRARLVLTLRARKQVRVRAIGPRARLILTPA